MRSATGKRRAEGANEDVQGKASRRRHHAKEPQFEVDQEPFNYLTFQRAPPTYLQAGSQVKVSALIANDLRDVILLPEEPLPLRLAWVTLSASGVLAYFGSKKTIRTTSSTWSDPSDAYHNIEVIVPQCKSNVQVRLAMWVEAEGTSTAPDETDELLRNLTVPVQVTAAAQRRFVQLPLPVLSASIDISPAVAKGSTKTSSITRLIRLPSHLAASFTPTPSSDGALLQIQESTGHALEKHIWDAALRLIHLMPSYFNGTHQGATDSRQMADVYTAFDHCKRWDESRERQPLRVVELGAGTALLSVAFAALWVVRARGQEKVVRELECWATDLEAAVPIMKENIALNSALLELDSVSFKAAALDWNDTDFSALLAPRPGKSLVDLILISDCTYNCDSFAALSRTIARLLRVDSTHPDRKDRHQEEKSFCLLAKKHRHVGEQMLWRDLSAAGLSFERLAGMDPIRLEDEGACSGWGVWHVSLQSTVIV